jgi:hypothetical protein
MTNLITLPYSNFLMLREGLFIILQPLMQASLNLATEKTLWIGLTCLSFFQLRLEILGIYIYRNGQKLKRKDILFPLAENLHTFSPAVLSFAGLGNNHKPADVPLNLSF